MNAREWIDAFAERLGVAPPTAEEWSTLLDLAGVAAHGSERVAAPVACWVTARAGTSPAEALAAARAMEGGDG
jgi:DNA-binding transcriptional regulator YdaS (Cro superfamily)